MGDPTERDVFEAPNGVLVGGEPLILRDRAGARRLICQLLDVAASRGGFAVFDADDLRAGPMARVWLDVPTPMAFHGAFVPAPTRT